MRWKVMVAVFLSVGIAVCQDRPAANSSLRREGPFRELTAINDAAMSYYSWQKRVPTSIKQLGPGERKIADQDSADLISSELASGIHDGYRFTVTGTKAGWTVKAVPLNEAGGFQTTYTINSRISQVKAKRDSKAPQQ
jgi:hypothetical protein